MIEVVERLLSLGELAVKTHYDIADKNNPIDSIQGYPTIMVISGSDNVVLKYKDIYLKNGDNRTLHVYIDDNFNYATRERFVNNKQI